MENTLHFNKRQRQRGITEFMKNMLYRYGETQFNNDGTVLYYFSKRSKKLAAYESRESLAPHLAKLFRLYLIETTAGIGITIGWRFKHIIRK